MSDQADLIWIAPWADSGPYGGWKRGKRSDTCGLGDGKAARVPRGLMEAYEAATDAQWKAEEALDDAAERYWAERMRGETA